MTTDTRETVESDNQTQNRTQIPRATYRFQFSPAFTFQHAAALVPYLNDLGISHCYASPIFKPRKGSEHGYDIVDYSELNPALGTYEDFDHLIKTLHQHHMGLILDIVPNHMGIGSDNVWWMDVLENGPGSEYARFFDIDWKSSSEELTNRVLLPILEDHYGRVLAAGKLRLSYDDSRFTLHYYEHAFPIVVDTYKDILSRCHSVLTTQIDESHEAALEVRSILTGLRYLPAYTELQPEKQKERQREQKILRNRFSRLYETHEAVRVALDETLTALNGEVGQEESFDALDEILGQQPYRLSFWRVAMDEINYRRFFDINDMAAVRAEIPQVFEKTHTLLYRLLGEGKVDGLRVDHPDGLWNPQVYFLQLQETYVTMLEAKGEDASELRMMIGDLPNYLRQPDAKATTWPLYVVAEKILSETEPLPREWGVYGTTGYDFMNMANGLFVDSNRESEINAAYIRFIGEAMNFQELIYGTKKKTMANSLASDLNARGHQLKRIVERNRRYRGFTLNGLVFAMSEVIACLQIYRTYITGPGVVSERDHDYINIAVEEAKRRNPRTPQQIFDFLGDTVLFQNIYEFDEEDRRRIIEFVMKFQQLTGPVMAKSVEDTAFYIFNRLVSLNEVGGEPEQFGMSVEGFHAHNVDHQHHWPYTMLALSTHDTKRSEDVRARINVLSEIPEEWREAISRWTDMNISAKTEVDDTPSPDRNDEYLLYQILLGAWSIEQGAAADETFIERIIGYMLKATKEAKVHTSWINPYNDYDAATQNFIRNILQSPEFLNDFVGLQQRVSYFGQFNSLAQTLLKYTVPGVPDTYQGNEMWDFSLVDPDNRRPVNYDLRQWAMGEIKTWIADGRDQLAIKLLEEWETGYIKLYITEAALQLRKHNTELFAQGTYTPLHASGNKAQHVCAFAYTHKGEAMIVIVPRLVVGLTEGHEAPPVHEVWQDTYLHLPEDLMNLEYINIFTDEALQVGDGLHLHDILRIFPVAILRYQLPTEEETSVTSTVED